MEKLLAYIRSIKFAVLICLLAMSSQAFHTFYSFWRVSSIKNPNGQYDLTFVLGVIQVLLFLTAFESFTLFYLMRGKENMAKFYSACLCVMNLYYYWINLEGLELALGIFISIIIPVSIFNIAEEIKKDYDESKLALTKQGLLDSNNDAIDKLQVQIDKLSDTLTNFIESLNNKKPARKKKTINLN